MARGDWLSAGAAPPFILLKIQCCHINWAIREQGRNAGLDLSATWYGRINCDIIISRSGYTSRFETLELSIPTLKRYK